MLLAISCFKYFLHFGEIINFVITSWNFGGNGTRGKGDWVVGFNDFLCCLISCDPLKSGISGILTASDFEILQRGFWKAIAPFQGHGEIHNVLLIFQLLKS